MINWSKPRRFTEYLQIYKATYRNVVMHRCVDKYEVRNYVTELGLGSILTSLYGVYNKAEDIDFDTLPNKFVMKTTNGGGGENVIICKDKGSIDRELCRSNLNKWLELKTFNAGREWAYDGIDSPKIVIEEYLENPDNPEAGIEDFKILCFNGKPEIIIVDTDRYIGHKRNFYDIKWNRIEVTSDCPGDTRDIEPPVNLDKMLEIASILSKEFPFVRVDLYNIRGKIYFGELTFYPWSGYVKFSPDEFDFKLGNYFDKIDWEHA